MGNKQIVEFGEKTNPAIDDHLLLQDDLSGYYMQVSRANLVRRHESLQIMIGNGSGTPSTGPVWMIYLPEHCLVEIKSWRMGSLDGASGAIQVDLWHDQNRTSASDADTICGTGNEPFLSSQSENSNTNLSGWMNTLLEGGCLVANLDGISGLTQVLLAIDVEIIPSV
jgi:hypothetical protein